MKRTFLLLIALFLATSINAQKIKTYSGEISKPEWLADLVGEEYYKGKGSYSYYEDSDEKRIPHGSFTLTFTKDALFGSIFKEIITGNYSHGKRNGQWTMKSMDKNGKVFHQYKFQYKNGVLHGPFSYTDEDYTITGSFSEGILSSPYNCKYSIRGRIHTIKGQLDEEGRPHGEWTIISRGGGFEPTDRTKLFYHGCLLYTREKDLSTGAITYEDQISPEIKKPSDLNKIHDTLIYSWTFVAVGNKVCDIKERDHNTTLLGEYNLSKIYPKINNWYVEIDTAAYIPHVKSQEEIRQDSIRRVEQWRQDSIQKAEQERQRIEQERQRMIRDSIRRAEEERRRIEQQDKKDISSMEIMIYRMVQEHELHTTSSVIKNGLRSTIYHVIPTEKLKKGIKDGEYLVLTTEDGKEFRDIFKEEYFTTQSGKVIDQQRISKEYEVRVATNQDGNLLIVYDIQDRIPFMLAYVDDNSNITYYTIKKSIGKKIKQY